MRDEGDDHSSANGSTSSRHHRRRDDGRRRDAFPRAREDHRRSGRQGSSHGGDYYRRRSRSPRYEDRYSGRGGDRYSRRSGRHEDDYDDRRRRSDDRGDKYRDRSPDRSHGRPSRGASLAEVFEGRGKRNGTPEPTDDERDRRTVFCQQLAARLRSKHLIDFFEKVGPVKDAQIVRDRVSNRSKGVGYVEFKEEESVQKAIDLTGQQLMGIPIIVSQTEAEKNRAARKNEGQPTLSNGIPFHRLYVGNIHFNVTEEDLEGVFSQYGEVEFVQLQKDDNGRSRGYGFVQFSSPDDAKSALAELNGFELAGRPIRVGLGNDKLHQESNNAMMQRFNQGNANAQGSSFSGAGGRGAHAGGNINFSSRDDKAAVGLSALDDSDVAGVNFNNFSRESLMKKLARTEEPAASAAPGKGTKASASAKAPMASFQPSRCILIKNVYDETTETDDNWEKELADEFAEECSDQYGEVVHCAVPDNDRGEGPVYVKFKDLKGGDNALKGLNGRLFAGRYLTASPVVDAIYHHMFPKARDL
ncbi:splicing factor, CC1-like protein [Myriangium duriaei CBS 260.36]|uniref:Splicing factor, CC1-like protein n=1 Tax=Myriangium duriaei CBS 260.36 TaxID=1168546 RepID=A0A9P4IX26_9PEZI|nr:splicing factor, CC1-like protein [Myriangium duriaei CBS 260.36]